MGRCRPNSSLCGMKDGLFNPFFGSSVDGVPDTNLLGEQAIVLIGDSNIVGQGATVGPTPTLGTVREWNGSAKVNVTNADLSVANIGSMWPKFGIDYNARTGQIPVFINCANGGSTFFTRADDPPNTWHSDGSLYSAMLTKVASGLSSLGVRKPKAIFVGLGINDSNLATSLSDINSAIASLITRLNADFPDVPIYFLNVGLSAGPERNSARKSFIRLKIFGHALSNPLVHFIHAPMALYDYNTSNVKADIIHYSQTGNNLLGAILDDYLEDVETYDKIACGIFSSFTSAVDSTKKGLISAFCASQRSNLALMETLQIFKSDVVGNTYIDFVGSLVPQYASTTFSANNAVVTAGATGSYIDHGWMIDQQVSIATDQDISIGVKTGTVTTAGGVTACLYGAVGSVDNTSIALFQTTTPSLQWRMVEDGSTSTILTVAPDTEILDNTCYEMIRTGANAVALYKNGTLLQSGTTAYEGTLDRNIKSGGRGNAAATVSNPIASEFEAFWVSKNTGFDHSGFVTALNTMLAGL